jgi:hypothetical protein
LIRFAVISLSTLAVLGIAFFLLIWHAQPSTAVAHPSLVLPTATPVSTQPTRDGYGPGLKPWMKSYDEQGRVVSQFTASEFTPQTDGSFLVENPVAEFFMDKGQMMKVTGDRGKIRCDSTAPGSSKGLMSTPTTTPRTGFLHHVHIEMYPTADAAKPTQWMDTDNIQFDNDHLSMWTEDITDGRGTVLVRSDQVPVTIRGEQYEFDGKGLTLIWNGVTRRLEELQILHGISLTIKDPSKLALPGMAAPEPAKTTMQFSPRPGRGDSSSRDACVALNQWPVEEATQASRLLDCSPVKLVVAQTTPPPKSTVQPPTPYRAIFHDHVIIKDAGKQMATADLMMVDFLQGSSGNSKPAAPAPNPPPSPSPATANVPATPPTTQAVSARSTPTTKPANGPVVIYWTGTLLVTPLRSEPMMSLVAGQSIVKLIGTGSPVKLTPEGSNVECAAATYRSPDGSARLETSPAFPRIHLTQSKGLMLDTEKLDYDAGTSLAVLSGPSELRVPVGAKTMDVHWAQTEPASNTTGILHVVRLPGQPNGVKNVDLIRNVHVKHPQFTLDSWELQLDLDLLPKAKGASTDAEEQLKVLTAIDDVHCRLIQDGKTVNEGIDSDKLVIHTERAADGGTVPREVVATGHVNAFDPEQGIQSEFLDAMLLAKPKPKASTKPVAATTRSTDDDFAAAISLESLHATMNVHAKLKTGATADTADLVVKGPEGDRLVFMQNGRSTTGGTTLTDGKKSSLFSTSLVELTPDQGGLKVHGPGWMKTVRATATTKPATMPAAPPQPMEVYWQDNMSLDSKANVADLYGHVRVKNHEADGTTDDITGDICHLDLTDTAKVDKPKNDKKKPATQDDALASSMGGKELKKLTLTGHVIGYTLLNAPDGTLLRQGEMHGEKVIYTAADQTAVIPGAGTLFMENHKPDAGNGSGNNRGAMAISWKEKLTYNQQTQLITIDGDTVTGFQQEANAAKPKKQEPMHLYAKQLVITLTKGEQSSPAKGHDAPANQQGGMKLSRMQAFGQVRFMAPTVDLTCGTVDYDPRKSLLIARGTPQEPGQTMNATQTVTGTFEELEYDTVNEEVTHVKGSKVQARPK